MALSLLPQEMRLSDVIMSRSAQACTTCRKQKRKCDKVLPACSRCASLQRACDYSEAAGATTAPSAEAFVSLQMKLAEIEAKLDATRAAAALHRPPPPAGAYDTPGSSNSGAGRDLSPGGVAMGNTSTNGVSGMEDHAGQPLVRNNFPSVFFLDSDVYKGAGVRIPKPSVDIPMGVLEILASTNVIEDSATTYFNTVHRWFPFISRKRMSLGISIHDGGPDLALLFLTMKLITTPPQDPDLAASSAALSHLYTTSKQFLALLESAGTVSILYLQAMILVTLYEYAHGIYPAAWMTSGNCVRYASMLGLPSYQESCKVLGQCTTWTEAEERRRVWWATHIMDRAISLGTKKPFAGGPNPPADSEFLPVDDLAWDEGDMGRSLQRRVGTPVGERGSFSPFARLAQASVAASRAMAHCKRATTRYGRARADGAGAGAGAGDEKPFDISEATEVLSDLRTLSDAIAADLAGAGGQGQGSDAYLALAPSRCLVWGTSLMVLDLYSCPEHMRPGAGTGADEARSEGELAMQVEAINGSNVASESIRAFAGDLLTLTSTAEDGIGEGAAMVSPLCFDALYCALATFHWQWKESGQREMKQGMDETRAALARVAPRWRLADEYLEIDKYSDIAIMMSSTANRV